MILPRVIRAEHEKDSRIYLTFSDGTEGSVDFESWVTGPMFEPLKNKEYFLKFSLS